MAALSSSTTTHNPAWSRRHLQQICHGKESGNGIHQPASDLAWHVFVSNRPADRLRGAAFRKHTYGTCRAPGRCDERYVPAGVGSRLDRSATVATNQGDCLLDCTLRNVRKLVC